MTPAFLAALTLLALPETPSGLAPLKLLPYPQIVSTQGTAAGSPPRSSLSVANVQVETEPGVRSTSAVKTHFGEIWAVTPKGPVRRKGERGRWVRLDLPRVYKPNQPVPHIDSEIRQIRADAGGTVWIATDQGVYASDGENWWHPLNRSDGMPYEDVLCTAVAPNGDLWGGTTQGAWRLRAGQWRYFWGRRWMPGNRVSDIVLGPDGAAWLTTDGGAAKIEERNTALADKAAHFEKITQERHNRRGYVTGSALKQPGDVTGGVIYEASDNDGLWTADYVAAEAFRYAVTKDPEARRFAKQSMEALLDLVRLSGYPGFPARALLKKGETASGYSADETVRVDGEPDKIWYTSPVDANLFVKGDTSSDELDGHYFAWFVYYDLVADDAERAEIKKIVRAVTNNLLDHDFTLIGHTGRKTRWGVFGPQYLNEDPRWFDERGLNSIEMLCYIKVAEHICGDKRFTDAYNLLIDKHHYLLNTLNFRRGLEWWAINHSDDQLGYLTYYPLIRLETNPARKAILLQSLTSTWNGNGVTPGTRPERSPFYNFIVGALTGEPCSAEEAVITLQEWPWDLVDWDVRNSHRHDVKMRVAQGVRKTETDRVLPASERQLMRWNGNPWSPDGGSAGRSEEDGAAWLLPYWLGRFHQIIDE